MDPRWIVDFLTKGKPLFARIPATDPGRLAWVAVVPVMLPPAGHPMGVLPYLRRHGYTAPPFPAFAIQAFELAREVERGFDTDLHEVNRRDIFVSSIEEVAEVLKSLGSALEALDQPWKCDFP
jgi:hypothetical protein